MNERRKFIEKCYIFLLFTLIIGLMTTINFYTSSISVHVYNFSKIQEAIIFKQVKLSPYSFKSKNSTELDQCLKFSPDKQLCNITITVKTTKSNHQKKLKPIIQTWFTQLASKVYFISDEEDLEISRLTKNHLIHTKCGKNHFSFINKRESLSCKLKEELKQFLHHPSNWYCHFDDDNYLNIQRLFDVLKNYDYRLDWYIGKKSIGHKLSVLYKNKVYQFSFATGGAGFCLSNSLFNKLTSYIEDFVNISNSIGLPDDCSIGFIIESLIGVSLTENQDFHSHLEYLGLYNSNNLKSQVSLSYNFETYNFVNISPLRNAVEDPTKFKSIHCLLYTKESVCTT